MRIELRLYSAMSGGLSADMNLWMQILNLDFGKYTAAIKMVPAPGRQNYHSPPEQHTCRCNAAKLTTRPLEVYSNLGLFTLSTSACFAQHAHSSGTRFLGREPCYPCQLYWAFLVLYPLLHLLSPLHLH